MQQTPNIFDYATSELSQDAFICWLIAWADESYKKTDPHLNIVARKFVWALVGKEIEINKVKVGRQWENIDVWALIDEKYFIIIENKKGSSEHSDQLNRYAEIARNHYKNKEPNPDIEIFLRYFKMEEQGDYGAIEEAGFIRFDRQSMLDILDTYFKETSAELQNNIISDYYQDLQTLDKKIGSYLTLPPNEWKWHSWQGFYTELQKYIAGGNWEYVPNPSGGFLGFWWHWHDLEIDKQTFELYLQLEQNKLVFKLHVHSASSEKRNKIRDICRKYLFEKSETLKINIGKYGRLGRYMGIAKVSNEYRQVNAAGSLDTKATIEYLENIMKLLNKTVEEIKKY